MPKPIVISGQKFKGYSDGDSLPADILGSPSVNAYITRDGDAVSRLGYVDTAIDLNQANKPATSLHVPSFNITFFALGQKVYYVNHNASDAVVDTGISLTDGTTSRFEEYNGVVYATNTTDGCYGFLMTKLNGAVSGGAATIVTDLAGATVANAFDTALSPGTKNLRVNGTNEAYTSITAGTGTFTLTGTASQAYTDNMIAIVVYNLSAVIPKGSKIVAWKESLNAIGISENASVGAGDRKETTLYFSQFATAGASEASVTWSGGTAGSEICGKSGKITNALATRDYLYIFKEGEVYYIPVSNVNATTGARPPVLLSSNYGCVNEDCAADLGNGLIVFLTKNKRLIGIRISTQSGAAVVFPDESFDQAIRNTLENLDADQSDSHLFYDPGSRRLFVECNVDSTRTTLVYDNNIASWTPPHTGKNFKSYYNKDGILYATSKTDDTIYEMESGMEDAGSEYETVIATPKLSFEDGRVTMELMDCELSGAISELAEISCDLIVNGGTPQTKTIDTTGITFDITHPLGSVTLGTSVLGGDPAYAGLADYDKRFAIYPRYAQSFQIVLSTTSGSKKMFSLSSYRVRANVLSTSLLTLS
jgi:hypothetical protein